MTLGDYTFLIFPVIFVTCWCLICLMISHLGGWSRLAKKYPSHSQASGKRFSMTSASVGGANYNNCLTIHTNETGVYLSVWPIFRLAHPPLFIPWSEINHPKEKRVLWSHLLVAEVGSPVITKITFPKKVFSSFQK